jgi:hypothetical protein
MTKLQIRIIDGDEIIDREMNDDELAITTNLRAEQKQLLEIEKAKAQAKAELLERLGITADEAKLLLA